MADLNNLDMVGVLGEADLASPLEFALPSLDFDGVVTTVYVTTEPEPPQSPLPLPSPSITASLGDIRLTLDAWTRGDALLVGGDLETDEGLETAMFLSLFLDRYADELEDPTERRGWWADGIDGTDDRIGSRLWLAERYGKVTAELPDQLRTWTREALQWVLDDGIARRVDITPTLTDDGYSLAVDVFRPNKTDPTRFRYARTWDAQEARR